MAKHTPEPWGLVGEPNGYTVWNVVDDGVNPGCVGRILARVCGAAVNVEEEEANGARIVACVNACAGIDDPADLRKQRDDLLAALNWYANADNYRFGFTGSYDDRNTMIEMDRGRIAREAIRKAEGKEQP